MTNKPQDADVAFIKALADMLNDNKLSEIKVKRTYSEDDSLNVHISKYATAAAAPAAPAPAMAAAPAAPAGAPAAEEAADDPSKHPGAVSSPMVGTVYMQAEPGAPSFISVGAKVAEGDTLLIVEAMKTMNHIPAPRGGTIKRILVDDGAAVEFGAPLVILE